MAAIEVCNGGANYGVRYIRMDTSRDTGELEHIGSETTDFSIQLVQMKQLPLAKGVSQIGDIADCYSVHFVEPSLSITSFRSVKRQAARLL